MKLIKKLTSVIVSTALLSSNVYAANFNLYSNGNPVTDYNNVEEGILSAVSKGDGSVAIAKYKDGTLVSLDFASYEEGLASYRANTILGKDDDTVVKIFSFDENMKPYMADIIPSAKDSNLKIYLNETFDSGSEYVNIGGDYITLSDGRVSVSYNGSSAGARFGTFPIIYPEKNIIVEADYELPSDGACVRANLMSIYNGGPLTYAYLHEDGLKPSTSGKNNPALVKRSQINADKKFNVAMKINLEDLTFDLYYNHEKVTSSPRSLSSAISYEGRFDGFSMYIPIVTTAGSIYVDNIKAYSGTEFTDIGNLRPNVHRLDFTNSPNWETDIYERPDSSYIAEKVLAKDHPRILLTKEKLSEIKNAKGNRMALWRDAIVPKADSYIGTNPYKYAISSSDSMENIDDAIALIMHCGLAYQLTGDMKYPGRVYKELEVIYNAAGKKTAPNGDPDYWNSYSYLCVSELSYALAIAYDWMYDAWTPAQRQAICDNINLRSLDRAYQSIFSQLMPSAVSGGSWWKNSNNWNGVCNGAHFLTAVAFMEIDPYKCANIAEACYRAFEYMLPRYAPMGAWTEGTGYWAYALRYLSISCAVMDDICGTDFGIHKTTGLENSMFYAISNEGKTGALSFGDVGGGHVHAPFLFYWARKYNNPQIGGAAIYAINKFDFTPDIYDLLYYDEDYVDETYCQPLSSYYEGTEVVSFFSGYDNNDTGIAMSGGLGTATSHDHIDSGGILLEKNGLKVLCDSGAEHYAAPSYFSTNRYWYYKARPEGHNIFVINPQNIYDSDGTSYYMGQSKSADSKITFYDEDDQIAVMDLTDAYSRDAADAKRKIYINGESTVIEDEITVRSDALPEPDISSDASVSSDADISKDGNIIEWYWHFKDTATAVVNNTTKYGVTDYGTAKISDDGKSVTLTFKDYTYNGSKFSYPGTVKTFTLTFESDAEFEIEIRDAVRNPYDAEVLAEKKAAGTFGYDYYRSVNTISKIVVKMKHATGTVRLKTVVN